MLSSSVPCQNQPPRLTNSELNWTVWSLSWNLKIMPYMVFSVILLLTKPWYLVCALQTPKTINIGTIWCLLVISISKRTSKKNMGRIWSALEDVKVLYAQTKNTFSMKHFWSNSLNKLLKGLAGQSIALSLPTVHPLLPKNDHDSTFIYSFSKTLFTPLFNYYPILLMYKCHKLLLRLHCITKNRKTLRWHNRLILRIRKRRMSGRDRSAS